MNQEQPFQDTEEGRKLAREPGLPVAWPTQADSLRHEGRNVTVFDAVSGAKILTGIVTSYTDLLGSGGILVPDPKRGLENVQGAIRFPNDPDEYKREMAKYRFRVEK